MQTLVHDAHPDKDIYFTECSGGGDSPFGDDLVWMMRIWFISTIRNWAKTVALRNLALDENHGPRIGGCDISSRPAPEVGQDYFDWELAVTGVTDMAEEIQRLKSLG